MQNGLDRQRVQTDLRVLLEGVEDLTVDLDEVERFARGIAAGRIGPATNRLPSAPRPPEPADLDELGALDPPEATRLRRIGHEALARGEVAVCVLNGGMATRFGGVVKGIVDAIDGRSFLEIKHAQARRFGPSPFLAMNSFATHRGTLEHVRARGIADEVEVFLQAVSLRLTPEGELFLDASGRVSPYAPGHGDFPDALRRVGLVRRLADRGVRALMLSNVDNLGADPDPVVIGYHLAHGGGLTIEVAPSVPHDAGGGPAWADGRLQIVESFRLPEGFPLDSLPYVNTNTLIFSLELLERDHPLTWFYVEKTVDGRAAVQMERLVGQMSAFVETRYLLVPRDGPNCRYRPIKEPGDLEALRSDPVLAGRIRHSAGDRL